MGEMDILYQMSLNHLAVIEADKEVLKQVGLSLAKQEEAFRELQLILFNHEHSYSHHGILGSSIEILLHWEQNNVEVMYLETKVALSMIDFRRWLAYTDLLLSPILPLGTTIELNKDLLPAALVTSMNEIGMPFLAIVLGRRLLLGPEDREYIDYLVSIYPYGLRADVNPIYISNFFIKKVLQEGYSDAIDEQYIENQHRKDYFSRNIVSEIYNVKGEQS